jgi:eukaryotic-like serine/threonine-protein kinase
LLLAVTCSSASSSPDIHFRLYIADFLEHDVTGMEREAALLMGKPGYEDAMLDLESDTAAYAGSFVKARGLTRRAVDSARRADKKEAAAEYEAGAAIREAMIGNASLAREQVQAALAFSDGRDVEGTSAIALGLVGDSAQAVRLSNDLSRRFPEDTFVQSEYLPMIRSVTILGRGNTSKDAETAIEALAPAAPYESGAMLSPAYLRGKAYLAAKQGTAAAAEFQRVLDHPGVVANNPIGTLAQLGLGRAYVLTGDTPKAKAAYQDFFALWNNADPDTPILKQAREEYARLQQSQARSEKLLDGRQAESGNLASATSNPVLTVGTSLPMAPLSLFSSIRGKNPQSPPWTGRYRQEIVVQGPE